MIGERPSITDLLKAADTASTLSEAWLAELEAELALRFGRVGEHGSSLPLSMVGAGWCGALAAGMLRVIQRADSQGHGEATQLAMVASLLSIAERIRSQPLGGVAGPAR